MARKTKYESMTVFEQIRDGLADGIAEAKGALRLRKTTFPAPPPRFSKARLIAIRARTGMSQSVFAGHLNVPVRTLQSWEQGARKPKAGEARLLQLMDRAPSETISLLSRV